MASTFAHLTGFLYGVRLPVQVGGATGGLPGRVEQRAVRRAGRGAPDHLHLGGDAVPARHPERAEHRRPTTSPRCVRFCCFGAPIPPAIVRAGPGSAGPSWPCSAAGGRPRTRWSPSASRATPRRRSSSATATRCPGCEIRVVDDDGTALPAGHRGPAAGDRAVPVRRLRASGWSMTAANCSTASGSTPATSPSIDADGYLKISGRTKDVIIRGGENIPVAYVENALYENPKIAAVAVVGIPDPRLQERACAVRRAEARRRRSSRFAEMRQFLAEKGVARQYWPERLEVMAELPRTASGKIQKFRAPRRDHRVRHDGIDRSAQALPGGRGADARSAATAARWPPSAPTTSPPTCSRALTGRLPSVDWDAAGRRRCSAARTRPARTTATSPGWRRCSPACRSRCPAAP